MGGQGACLVRVPTENVKQNLQAGRFPDNRTAIQTILKTEGLMGFYNGFLSTILREVSGDDAQPGLFPRGVQLGR